MEKTTKPFNFNLEALRGIAALIVIWGHLIIHKYWLDPHYNPTGIFSFVAPGHLSVLVFFVLSGYVIGLNHSEPLRRTDILPYLKKRFTRIYPIYFVSMVLALLVARHAYPIGTVVSNLTMMQNLLSPTIMEINPAWSLHFEVLFYLLFIPLSFFRLNAVVATLASTVLGVVAYLLGGGIIALYAIGFAYWLCGVVLARHCQRSAPTSFATMVSMLLLLVSLEKFNILTTVFYKIAGIVLGSGVDLTKGILNPIDFTYLPYCLLIVLVFASKDFAFRKYYLPVLLFLPAYNFLYILRIPTALHEPTLVLPVIFYGLAVLVYLFKKPLETLSAALIKNLATTGAISYGLYIIHFPIIAIFTRIFWFSGTALTFSIRSVAYLFLCVAAAYFLEKRFQPLVKRAIEKRGSAKNFLDPAGARGKMTPKD